MKTMIRDCIVLLTLALVLGTPPSDAVARTRRGDRFGLRIGTWPQAEAKGSLGQLELTRDGVLDTVVARFNEPSAMVSFLELYGLFHLRGMWSLEAAVGYAARRDVMVTGYSISHADSLLLGEGRIDLIPLFAGLRGEFPIGDRQRHHNIYVRGGVSLIFATESPSGTHAGVEARYSPGSEGAPGFVIGGGGEYYVGPRHALTFDVQFRHAWFTYARNAKFNQYGLWGSIGILISTR